MAAQKDGWWIKVCRELTKAPEVVFQIGPDSNTYYQYIWNNALDSDFDVRQDYRNLHDVWINGYGERGKAKYFCVRYKEKNVKHYDFDNDEDHNNSQDDYDAECRCA